MPDAILIATSVLAVLLLVAVLCKGRLSVIVESFCENPKVRGGVNYPIVVDCNGAKSDDNPYARGHYEYTCPSGKPVPKQFSKYAGWNRTPITSCDMTPSQYHAPKCF